MEQIIITHIDGTILNLNSKENVSSVTKASQTVSFDSDTVDISIQSAKKLKFYLGDKITVYGRDYTLNIPAKEKKVSDSHFEYDIQLEGVQYDLLRASFNVNVDTTGNIIQDLNGNVLTGDIKMFLDIIVANANRIFPGKWSVGTYPSGTETKTISFSDSDTCLSVIQSLCNSDNYDTEFNISIDGSGNRTINIGQLGSLFPFVFEYGKGKGIYELTREKVSSSNIINRLFVYGGSKNIVTTKYRADVLCLPGKSKALSYIEDADSIAKYGIWEGKKIYDSIYPRRIGTITALGSSVYKFADNAMFDLNEKDSTGETKYLLSGTSAKVHFNTGKLAGYEFETTAYDHETKTFTIVKQTDENNYSFPSETLSEFQFAVGDQYVLIDVNQPQSYIDTAETDLQTSGQSFLDTYSKPRIQYSLTIDQFYLKSIMGGVSSNIFSIGDVIHIKDSDLEVDKAIRITRFSRDLINEFSYTLTISDIPVEIGTIARTVTDVKSINTIVNLNNLNDPARARQNYKASQEVLNMVFDPDGYFTDKIRPLSIETSMLSVSSKSQQFSLTNTLFQPNYLGAKNRIVYTGGTLTHQAITDSSGNSKIWAISDGDLTLTSDSAYYIYAKCSRTTGNGIMLFSTEQIKSDSDVNYYHFWIGIANSVDSATNTRLLSLTYGGTTINGRHIKTGRIQSQSGVMYVDLDTGDIQGNFRFTSGVSVNDAVSSAQSTASAAGSSAGTAQLLANAAKTQADNALTTANNIQVGGRNYIKTIIQKSGWVGNTSDIGTINYFSDYFRLTTGGNNFSAGIFRYIGDTITDSSITGKQMILSFDAYCNGGARSMTVYVDSDSSNKLYPQLTTGWKRFSIQISNFNLNSNLIITGLENSLYYFFRNFKLEIGNKATDFSLAQEDVPSALTYLASALQGSTEINGGLLATTVLLLKALNGQITAGMSGLQSDNILMWGNGTYADALAGIASTLFKKDGTFRLGNGAIQFNGSKIIIDTDNFDIDANGNVSIAGTVKTASDGVRAELSPDGAGLKFYDASNNVIGSFSWITDTDGSKMTSFNAELVRSASVYSHAGISPLGGFDHSEVAGSTLRNLQLGWQNFQQDGQTVRKVLFRALFPSWSQSASGNDSNRVSLCYDKQTGCVYLDN
jgi:hypothetical protein